MLSGQATVVQRRWLVSPFLFLPHPGESRSRVPSVCWLPWTPAFAGVTVEKMRRDRPHAIALRRGGGQRGGTEGVSCYLQEIYRCSSLDRRGSLRCGRRCFCRESAGNSCLRANLK